jgi:hypothetical protein
MLQQLIIALLVLSAACYVAWTFMPMARRQWLLDALAARGIAAARISPASRRRAESHRSAERP